MHNTVVFLLRTVRVFVKVVTNVHVIRGQELLLSLNSRCDQSRVQHSVDTVERPGQEVSSTFQRTRFFKRWSR